MSAYPILIPTLQRRRKIECTMVIPPVEDFRALIPAPQCLTVLDSGRPALRDIGGGPFESSNGERQGGRWRAAAARPAWGGGRFPVPVNPVREVSRASSGTKKNVRSLKWAGHRSDLRTAVLT